MTQSEKTESGHGGWWGWGRVSSGIPCYGIPPEFCGIFSRNSAGIKLQNSITYGIPYFTEFRIFTEFRMLRNSVFLRNSAEYGIPYCRIPYSVDTEFLRNSAGIPYSVSWILSKKKFRLNFFWRNNGHSRLGQGKILETVWWKGER